MDRQPTVRRVDGIIEPGGAVVLSDQGHPPVPDNRWCRVFEELVDRYAAGDAARAVRRSPDWPRHEAVLLDSPFPSLERFSVIERRQTPLGRLVDCVLSLSSVSRDRIGALVDDLAREVRQALAGCARRHGDGGGRVRGPDRPAESAAVARHRAAVRLTNASRRPGPRPH
jgi:hypothetical protein